MKDQNSAPKTSRFRQHLYALGLICQTLIGMDLRGDGSSKIMGIKRLPCF